MSAERQAPARRADFKQFEPIETRWADNDVYGHVNNVVYYGFFDTAVNRRLARAGLLDIEHGETIGLVVETGCRYHAATAFPDALEAGVKVAQRLLCALSPVAAAATPLTQEGSEMANLATEVKLYGRWSFEDVEVKDISLEDYIACKPKYAQFLPHSQGRWQKKRFRKAQCPIVERLVCSIMRKGRNNGKKVMAVRIVKHAFEIIHLLTDQNPVQVFVEAVVNCGPREDSTRVGGGGAVRRQACDVSPLRRVNSAIYLIAMGSRESAFRNIKTIAECLADEIMNAAKVRPRLS